MYDIPQHLFSQTLSDLIEFQQPDIAEKLQNVLEQAYRRDPTNFNEQFITRYPDSSPNYQELIKLYWTLLQLEWEHPKDLSFLKHVDFTKLDSQSFQYLKQLLMMAMAEGIDVSSVETNLNEMFKGEWPQHLMTDELASQTDEAAVQKMVEELQEVSDRYEIVQNSVDEMMNLVEILLVPKSQDKAPLAIVFLNKAAYLPYTIDDEPILRRSFEVRK